MPTSVVVALRGPGPDGGDEPPVGEDVERGQRLGERDGPRSTASETVVASPARPSARSCSRAPSARRATASGRRGGRWPRSRRTRSPSRRRRSPRSRSSESGSSPNCISGRWTPSSTCRCSQLHGRRWSDCALALTRISFDEPARCGRSRRHARGLRGRADDLGRRPRRASSSEHVGAASEAMRRGQASAGAQRPGGRARSGTARTENVIAERPTCRSFPAAGPSPPGRVGDEPYVSLHIKPSEVNARPKTAAMKNALMRRRTAFRTPAGRRAARASP